MGWAAGFRAGSDVAQRAMDNYKKQQLEQGLSQEAAKYDVVEGAAGPELEQNIQQVQGLKQQAIAGGMTPEMAAQQYDPSIAELTRRSGLTQPDFSISQAGRGLDGNAINYATRQEARQAAAPLRSEGLAGVYRRGGDIEGADRLEARALDQRRGLQQYELGQYQLGEAKTNADRVAGVTEAEKAAADYIKKQAEARGGFNNLTEADYTVALQNQINTLRAKGYQAEASALINSRNKTIMETITTQNAQYTQELGEVLSSRSLEGFGKLYDKYVKDGATVTSVTKGEGDSIIVNRKLDNGDETEPVVFKNFEELEASARAFTDPKALSEFSQRQFDNNLKSAAVETQKSQFAEQMGVRKDELALSGQRLGVDLARLEIAAQEAARKTLPGQIRELESLGYELSDAEKKALGGIKPGDDPLLKAELEVIAGMFKGDTVGGKPAERLQAMRDAMAGALRNSQGRAQTKTMTNDLKAAGKKGGAAVPEALSKLRQIEGMTEPFIRQLAKDAGIPYTPPQVDRAEELGADAVPPPASFRARPPMGLGGSGGLNTNPTTYAP
jgi:hypothetical protein